MTLEGCALGPLLGPPGLSPIRRLTRMAGMAAIRAADTAMPTREAAIDSSSRQGSALQLANSAGTAVVVMALLIPAAAAAPVEHERRCLKHAARVTPTQACSA